MVGSIILLSRVASRFMSDSRGDDIKLLNEQSHQMALMASNDQQLKLQVESYERAQQVLDTTAR